MSCQHNTVSKCHSCCSPIVVQVPGLQGTGIVWENCTDEEKADIAKTCLTPIQEEVNNGLTKIQGTVESCQSSADLSKSYAEESKSYHDEVFNKKDEIIAQIQAEGTTQDNRVIAEGDTQVNRIQLTGDQSVITAGSGCFERFWIVASDTSAGTNIEIPGGIKYIVGRHHLRVSWNGLVLFIGQNFSEVGATDTFSDVFRLTFDAKAGDEIDVWIGALGKGNVDEAIALAGEASAAVAELSRKVVYKEETT